MENKKFLNPKKTLKGEDRALIKLKSLDTLWLNTGTICNLTCKNCYIESSPKNDSLSFLSIDEVKSTLDEIKNEELKTKEIGITGGEPFVNKDIIKIIEEVLIRGFKLLILTNAMKPMMNKAKDFLDLNKKFSNLLTVRVSVDHYKEEFHEEERGVRTFNPMLEGLKWLSDNDFKINVAARTRWNDKEENLRKGYSEFFKENNIKIDAFKMSELILFPEMDETIDVPEITNECFEKVGISKDSLMCSNSRMLVKHKGDDKLSVMACTLLAYDSQFNLGSSLKEASKSVYLNHPHCSKFCVFGGGSCSG